MENLKKSEISRSHRAFSVIILFILLSMVRYYWPESGLTLFQIILLSFLWGGLIMLEEILTHLESKE